MTTFADVLARLLRDDAGRPLVTFYDDATGERVELSVTTYANWVAKAASLLVEELRRSSAADRLRVDLPPTGWARCSSARPGPSGWWSTTDEQPDAVVCGPDGLDRWAAEAGRLPVLACSLLPLGVRFAEPLPPACTTSAWRSGRSRTRSRRGTRPEGDDRATDGLTQEELWSAAAAGTSLPDGGRLLATANPASPSGLAAFIEPLARGGSLVLVSHPDAARLEATVGRGARAPPASLAPA